MYTMNWKIFTCKDYFIAIYNTGIKQLPSINKWQMKKNSNKNDFDCFTWWFVRIWRYPVSSKFCYCAGFAYTSPSRHKHLVPKLIRQHLRWKWWSLQQTFKWENNPDQWLPTDLWHDTICRGLKLHTISYFIEHSIAHLCGNMHIM